MSSLILFGCSFWGTKEILSVENLRKGKTNISEYCSHRLHQLDGKFYETGAGLQIKSSSNAPAQENALVMEKLGDLK